MYCKLLTIQLTEASHHHIISRNRTQSSFQRAGTFNTLKVIMNPMITIAAFFAVVAASDVYSYELRGGAGSKVSLFFIQWHLS
jgi:hypothetical protein